MESRPGLTLRALGVLVAALTSLALIPGSAGARRPIHHPDPAKVFKKSKWPRRARASALSPSFASDWPCAVTQNDRPPIRMANAPQVKLVYAYPSDGSALTSTTADLMQADAKAVRDRLATESGGTKSVRFDTGGLDGTGGACDTNPERYLDIQEIALDDARAAYNAGGTFGRLTTELKSKLAPPAPGARVDYVVYADRIQASGAAGEASIPQDDSDDLLNAVNQGQSGDGRLFAVVYGLPASGGFPASDPRKATLLHELSHNLGAVQDSAPHSSGAGHCFDEYDVMCYDDDGPRIPGGGPDFGACPSGAPAFSFSELYDCNQDDYFDPAPAGGSYLATHWNAFDSVYLCDVDLCDAALSPPAAVALQTTHPGGLLSLAVTAVAGIAHHEWDIDGDGVFDHDTGSSPELTPVWDTPGARTVRVRASKADGTFSTATVEVTPTPPTPQFSISGNLVAGETLQLDASATDDPDGLIDSFRWDLDGDGSYETNTGLTRSAATSFAAPGTYSLGLLVDFAFGTAWSRTSELGIAAPPAEAGTPLSPTPPPTGPTAIAGPTLTALHVRLAKLRRRGLPLVVTCGDTCSIDFTLKVSAKVAKKLRLRGRRGRPIVIGRLRGELAAGTTTPTLRLTKAARRALKRARSLRATLAGSVTQSAGVPLRVSKRLRFKR